MNRHRSLFTLAAACAMGAMGALVFLALPLLIGLFIDELGFSEQQAGLVASAYFATYFIASASAFLWIDRISLRRCGSLACLCIAAGGSLATLVSTPTGLACAMALAGVGGGMAFSIATSVISQRPGADRDFGWLLATQQLLAALYLIASGNWNLDLSLLFVTALALVLVPGTLALPSVRNTPECKSGMEDGHPRKNQAWFALLALMINFMALSALWAFVERIGAASGLDPAEVGSALSLSMLAGLAGALLVTRLAGRVGRQLPLWLSALAFLSVCAGYSLHMNWPLFLAVTALLSFSWNFGLAYQMSIVATVDDKGKFSALIPAAQGAGAMLGPILGGFLASSGNYNNLLLCVVALIIVSITGFSVLARTPVFTRPATG
jgi:predicted MFS family arabinose efflux permease